MLTEHNFSAERNNSLKIKYPNINPAVFEKMIYAFSLIELLAGTDLNFIFKGGTSLLLMPVNSYRLSIDVDIITGEEKSEVDKILKDLIKGSVFTNFKEDTGRRKTGIIPGSHYNFDFPAKINTVGMITLDILFDDNPYSIVEKSFIKNKWIETTEPYLTVNIPSVNSILGDKLTAFAPDTTGIPYWLGNPASPDKRIEMIKQLYDVSNLINHCTNLYEAKDVFTRVAAKQIEYFNLNIRINDIIDDVFNTALLLAKRDKNTEETDRNKYNDFLNGLKRFDSYLIFGHFRIEDAIASSAKAAYFLNLFNYDNTDQFELYNNDTNISELEISNLKYNFLNRFKKTNKQAFYYWYKCLDLKNQL